MPQRLYLTNAAATFTPSSVRGTWNDASSTGVSALTKYRAGSNTLIVKAEASATNNYRSLMRRFVSDPFTNSGNFAGTIDLCMAVQEESGSQNAFYAFHAYITVGDTNVVRGTVASNKTDATEWPTDIAARKASFALSTVACQAGDRLVIEVGFSDANTSTTSYQAVSAYGGTGSDLVPGEAFIPFFSSRCPWIDITGADAVFSAPARNGGTVTMSTGPVTTTPLAGKIVTNKQVTTTTGPTLSLPSAFKGLTVVTSASLETSLTVGFRIGSGLVVQNLNPTTEFETLHRSVDNLVTTSDPNPLTRVFLEIGGDIHESTPGSELVPATYQEPRRKGLRFLVQEIRTDKWVDWDLPLIEPEITWTLSGPMLVKGKLRPELPLGYNLEAWAHYIHAEEDGQIRASGIVQPGTIDSETESLTVEAMGVAGYPNEVIFGGEISEIQVDPIDVVRSIWDDVLNHDDAPRHVTVADTVSPIRLGKPSVQQVDENGVPQFDEETDSETGAVTSSTPKMTEEQPYELFWFNVPVAGQEIDNLAKETAFDYCETVSWNDTKTFVNHHIDIGYPRLGRLRNDLRFAQDENLTAAVPVVESPDFYASETILQGAGEGRKGIFGRAAQPHSKRVRVVRVAVDKSITDQARADTAARDDLRLREAVLSLQEITISDTHPNAPIGSYAVGDDITVIAEVPWVGDVVMRNRITSFTWKPDVNKVTLQLLRSEQFVYGRSTYDPTIDNVIDPTDSGGGGPKTYTSTTECLKLDGQNHFKLQVGFAGDSSSSEISPSQLANKYSHPQEYVLNSNKTAVQFWVRINAPTTSGSTNPRSELREMDQSGNEIAWAVSGDNWCQATLKFTHLPEVKQSLCGMQVHDESSDLIQVLTRVVGGQLKLMYRLNGKDADNYVLANSFESGTEVKVKTQILNGVGQIYVGDMSKPLVITGKNGVPALDAKGKCYFKVGSYPQSSSGEADSDYASVEVRQLGHYHPGWPQPVFDPDNVGGGSYQLAFGSCINGDDSDAFTKIAALKPKYFAICGDLVYKDGKSGIKSLFQAQLNQPKLSSALDACENFIYTPSDHDLLENNATGATNPSKTSELNAAIRSLFPEMSFPNSSGLNRTWADGHIRYIVLDERTFKTGSTVLGSAQKTWLQGLLASDEYPLIIMIGDTEWAGPAASGEDNWRGYDSERQLVGGWCADSPAKTIRIAGNMHCLGACEDGLYGIDKIWQSSPFKNNSKVKFKGEGYKWTYPTNDAEGDVVQQYGVLTIKDGAKSITVNFDGYSSDGTKRGSDSLTVTL